jgi:hypothetical protein
MARSCHTVPEGHRALKRAFILRTNIADVTFNQPFARAVQKGIDS